MSTFQKTGLAKAKLTGYGRSPAPGPHDHPEPWAFRWDETEIRAIQAYARQAVEDDRAQRGVPDEIDPIKTRKFLSDAITASGLLAHGKQSRALSDRIAAGALELMPFFTAAPTEPQPAQAAPDERKIGPASEADMGIYRAMTNQYLKSLPPGEPQQERKPMTYREIAEATTEWAHVRSDYTIGIIRAAERHHGISAISGTPGDTNAE